MTVTATPTPAPIGIRQLLRIPAYRNLVGGQAVSDIGDGITMLLLLLVVNELTGSTTALALMAIAEAIPQFTVGLVAGVYVDRWNRRTVMLAADLLRAIVVIGFAFAATAELVPVLYVLAFVQSSISTFFRPARGAIVPRVVPAEGLPAANSLTQGSHMIGWVIGSGIAGALFGLFGTSAAGFAIDAATFLVSFAFVSRLPASLGRVVHDGRSPEEGATGRGGDVRRSLLEGLAIVRRSRALSGTLIAAAVSMLGLGAVNVLFVPLLDRELDVAPAWMAGIDLAQTSAMILAAGVVALLARRFAPTTVISAALAGLAGCMALLAGVTEIWHVIVVLFVVGWLVTPLQAMLQTIVQTASTDGTRGRVVSLLQASMSTASVASMAVGGVLGDVIGIREVFVAAAAIVLGAAAISVVLFRGARSARATPESVTAPAASPAP